MADGPTMIQIDLGPMPADSHRGGVLDGLRGLMERRELCDVVFVVNDQSFHAHRVVLAAASASFQDCLSQLAPAGAAAGGAAGVMKLEDISHPEAVEAMLSCIYEPSAGGSAKEYTPSSDEVNSDVLRLAQRFQIARLREHAAHWFLRGLSTSNVLKRLVACEEFGLVEVRNQILEQVTANPEALFVLARDPEIVKLPVVLQDLLVRILKLLGLEAGSQSAPSAGSAKPAGRAGRKAGA